VKDLCGGETYSFAIFGGVVALRELQMCMALSVGVVLQNLPAVGRIVCADVRIVNAHASIVNAEAIIVNAEAKI